MSSHAPFLAIRPDGQYSTDVKSTEAMSSAIASARELLPAIDMESAVAASPEASLLPAHSTPAARIPRPARLFLVCIISLALSMGLNTLISEYTGIQLAVPSRRLAESWEIGAILSWRVAQIVLAWLAGYDWLDLTALTFLTNYPFYYLLNSFWAIPSTAISISLAIDVVSIAVPFAILRPTTRPRLVKTANQALAADSSVMALFAAQGVAIYSSFFYLSYYLSSISVFMVRHFDILSLDGAHNSSLWDLLQHFGVNGIMAMIFLFKPAMAAPSRPSLIESSAKPAASKRFNPETATLSETLAHNLGLRHKEWSYRAEVLVKRTVVLASCVFANTAIRAFATVEGTDVVGALGWSGLWTLANVLVGVVYTVLENEY